MDVESAGAYPLRRRTACGRRHGALPVAAVAASRDQRHRSESSWLKGDGPPPAPSSVSPGGQNRLAEIKDLPVEAALGTDRDVGRPVGTHPSQQRGVGGITEAPMFQTPDDDARRVLGGNQSAQRGQIGGGDRDTRRGPCSVYVRTAMSQPMHGAWQGATPHAEGCSAPARRVPVWTE